MTTPANVFEISINGELQQIQAGASVATLLSSLELEGRRVAVAINRAVVPKGRFAEHALCEGDRVEILEAVGGG